MGERAVTFAALQVEFARLWQDGNILPESVTISEADYHAFAKSVRAESDIDLRLGAIMHVKNHVNGSMVRLIRDAHLPPGTFSVGYHTDNVELDGDEQ